jgi:hypothetical protein
MVQPILDIGNNKLDAFEKGSRTLALFVSNTQITTALLNRNDNQVLALQIVHYNPDDVLNNNDFWPLIKQHCSLLTQTELDCKIWVTSTNAMLYPAKEKQHATAFLQTHYGLPKQDIVINDIINNEIQLILGIDGDLLECLTSTYPNAPVAATLANLTKQALSSSSGNLSMFLFFTNNIAELVLVENGLLLLAKCISFISPETILYELLNICKQLNKNVDDLYLLVNGTITTNSPLNETLLNYFKNVTFRNPINQNSSNEFVELPTHYLTIISDTI